MNAQDSKAYSDYYEVSEHYPDFDDYCEFMEELYLSEILELYCEGDITDELGDQVSSERMFIWWDNQLPEFKTLKLSEAYKEGWRVDLYIASEEQKIEDSKY